MRIDNPSFNPIDIAATSSHAVSASYALTASILLDSAPPVIVSGAAPSNAEIGDLWFDSVKGDTFVYYSASTWVPATDNVIASLSSSYSTFASTASLANTASFAEVAQYTKGTGLVWSGRLYGSPANITGATIGGTATYVGAAYHVELVQNSTNNQGYVTFQVPKFDFSQDFRVSLSYFISTPTVGALGDGIMVSLGVNNISTINYPFSIFNDGGLKFGIRSYWSGGVGGPFIAENQAVTLGANTNDIQFTNNWRELIFEVRTNNMTNERVLHVLGSDSYQPESKLPLVAKVSTFVPTGDYITVSSNTGAAYAPHYFNYIAVENI